MRAHSSDPLMVQATHRAHVYKPKSIGVFQTCPPWGTSGTWQGRLAACSRLPPLPVAEGALT